MMRDSEETIQRVLAGLRDAEAPDGMERRIVDALEDRASGLAASTARGWKPVWLTARVWRVAFAGMIAVSAAISLAIGAGHRYGTTRTQSEVHSVSAGAVVAARTAGAGESALHTHGQTESVRAETSPRTARLTGAADGASRSEMRAMGHPAPQAPLTEQERLLLRMVQTEAPEQIAMLNPEIRAKQEAQSEAKFQEFVEQSIKGDRE
ncbi:MAG: hypothetical protein ABSG51_08270 [Terracidiphilus sp.]